MFQTLFIVFIEARILKIISKFWYFFLYKIMMFGKDFSSKLHSMVLFWLKNESHGFSIASRVVGLRSWCEWVISLFKVCFSSSPPWGHGLTSESIFLGFGDFFQVEIQIFLVLFWWFSKAHWLLLKFWKTVDCEGFPSDSGCFTLLLRFFRFFGLRW